MPRYRLVALVTATILASAPTVWNWGTVFEPGRKMPLPGTAVSARLSEEYGKLPMGFYPNGGLTDDPVRFMSGGAGYELFLAPSEHPTGQGHVLRTALDSFPDAHREARSDAVMM